MTVLINGSTHLPAGDREKALAETADLVAETRRQKGCRQYVWSADPTSTTKVYVYENWASVEDLAAHLAGPYYQNMLAALGKYGVTDTEVSKFKVALEEPVYDPKASLGQIFLPSERLADTLYAEDYKTWRVKR